MSLQGQIEEMGLGAVIQTLSLNHYRGTLRIETEDAGSQFFFISEGEIVLVRQVAREPVRLGDLLIRAGKISEADLEEALSQQKELGLRLGEALVHLGKTTQAEIEAAVRHKFEEEFLDLFLLDRGHFEFIFGLTPEALFGPEEKLERVTLSTSGLMMEAMRRLDEWQGMIQGLGSFDTIYRNRVSTISAEVTEYQFENVNLPASARSRIYELLDGTRSLREVIGLALRDGIASRLETFVFLHALKENDLVKEMDFRTLLGEAKKALGGGDVPGAAKYIRAILGNKQQLDLNLIRRYLEFLRKYQRPRLAFDEARRFAAQSLAADDSATAITLYEEAIALDRNAEVIDRLFYALLRANRRERAVAVGLMLRDFLTGEAQLQVAVRVCKNLQELAPGNPEVIELSGLILQRQERNEEAVAELERALVAMDADHPRRREVIKALLVLQPDRDDLRDEQESLELRQAQAQLRREKRRRWTFVGGTLAAVVLLWRGYAEFRARSIMAQVVAAKAEPLSNPLLQLKRLSGLLQDAPSWTTVSSAAHAEKAAVDAQWDSILSAEATRRRQEQAEEQEAEQQRRAAAERQARLSGFEELLTAYRGLVATRSYEEASERAAAAAAEYRGATEPAIQQGLRDLRVFTRIASDPAEAQVVAEGRVLGATPLTVPVPVGGAVAVRVRRPGYRVVELELAGDAFHEERLTMTPGPTWRVSAGGAPVAAVLWSEGVVVGLPDGRLRALRLIDGSVAWEQRVLSSQTSPLVGLALVGGTHVVAVKGSAAALVELATGQLEWDRELGGDRLFAPAAGRVSATEVIAIAGETTIALLDGSTGTVLKRLRLPAKAVAGATCGTQAVFLPLEDRVLALDPANEAQPLRWARKELAPDRALVYSATDRSVLAVSGAKVTALAEDDGAVVSVVAPQVGTILGLALVNERLYSLGKNGLLSVVRASDGLDLTGARPIARAPSGAPVAIGNEIALVDGAGKLLRVTLSGRTREEVIELGGPVTLPPVGGAGRVLCVLGDQVALVEPVAD